MAGLALGVQFDTDDLAWYPVGILPLSHCCARLVPDGPGRGVGNSTATGPYRRRRQARAKTRMATRHSAARLQRAVEPVGPVGSGRGSGDAIRYRRRSTATTVRLAMVKLTSSQPTRPSISTALMTSGIWLSGVPILAT